MSAPGWAQMLRVFGRIGLLSFGGPAAQIALMHKELVEKHQWLSEQSYLRALSLCMLLPGPEAMQLATYAGWRLRGTLGGLLAGLLFVVPGALVITVLALGYAAYGQVPLVQAAFVGIKATVIVVVVQALLKVARKALIGRAGWVLAALSFVGLFVLGLPYPLIVLGAGVYGWTTAKGAAAPAPDHVTRPRNLRTLLVWGGLWALALAAVWGAGDPFLMQVGLFYSNLAVVTFGGAYAVLAYMTQTVVQDFGWISTAAMIDALGLAETTPGPLILVTQFVAMLAGFAQNGVTGALIAGALALWVTFIPCFLWIFLAGPYLDRIASHPRAAGALQAITAAVVGVIANLSLWFALHVMFTKVGVLAPLALPLPEASSFVPLSFALTALAALLMIGARLGFVTTMALMAALALGFSAF